MGRYIFTLKRMNFYKTFDLIRPASRLDSIHDISDGVIIVCLPCIYDMTFYLYIVHVNTISIGKCFIGIHCRIPTKFDSVFILVLYKFCCIYCIFLYL